VAVRILRIWKTNMPSRTLTPDPPDLAGAPAQRIPPDLPDVPGQLVLAESPAFSELRLVTVPAGWPPYDCETHGAACPLAPAMPTLEPHVGRAPERARAAETTTARTAVPPGAAAQAATSQAAAGHAVTGQADAGQAAAGQAVALSRQYAQAIVEILAGSRPLRQTIGWTTERVRAQIGDLARVLASDQRPRIKRVVASQPTASVVEMTVVINFGGRSRALAMRFEQMPARRPVPGLPGRPARWFCTELETG
jgi:Family of unknown function (DUF6459)